MTRRPIDPQHLAGARPGPDRRDGREIGPLLHAAIACQHLYIEAVLGVDPYPISAHDDGWRMDDQPVICAYCGRAGHASAICEERRRDEEERPY